VSAAILDVRRSGGAAFAHAFSLGWRDTWAVPGALVGTFLSYAVILSIWASLFRLLPAAALARLSLQSETLVWYLAVTEIVAFSIGYAYRDIQDEIKNGGVAAFLVRPLGYVYLVAAQELGRTTAKLSAVALPAAALAFALTHDVPLPLSATLPLMLSIAAGVGLLLAVQISIGLTTAWLGTARPVFFIVQKLMFVLGGLVVPLDAYPRALAAIAWLTPFPAILYAPASATLDPTGAHMGRMLALQVVWLVIAWISVAALGKALERRLVREGVCA
jgi:ABC-2 type transport system permease protein